ncbi:MAG: peptidoglycan-binding protein [Clostridiaceae bacterium]|nr:peptidoglycan-binding protein [Eubacteriales bacterium]
MRRFKRAVRKFVRSLYALADKLPQRLRFLAVCIPLAPIVLAILVVVLIAVGAKNVAAASAKGAADLPALPSPASDAAHTAAGDVVISLPSPSPTPAPIASPTPSPTPDPTLKRGDQSEEVTRLQERLMRLGYLDIDEPTLLFGPATEDAVQRFQRQIGVAQDGIAGPETLDRIYADDAPKYLLKLGMDGDDVKELQLQLVDLGYMTRATGHYGDETTAAIKEFQKRNSLSADGLTGEATMDRLYSDKAVMSASKAKEKRRKANISEMIKTAKAQLGKKYVLGNRGPNSFDCSGLVYYCLKTAGSNRTRLTAAGYSKVDDWEKITDINKLKAGDLILFYDNDFTKVGHVGIIISSTLMIDASSGNGKVMKREYKTPYWKKHFVCGRRPW